MSKFLDSLTTSPSLSIKQKFKVAELFGFETRNRYTIRTDHGVAIGYCAEAKLGWGDILMRQFLGHWRTFDILGFEAPDQTTSPTFRAHHPFRWFFNRLDIFVGDRLIGSLQQKFAWFNRRFDFLDGRGNLTMAVNSPFWQFWQFPVSRNQRQVALIAKKWSGLTKEMFTDSDNFQIMFKDSHLTTDQKLLILVAAIFVDILYFETQA